MDSEANSQPVEIPGLYNYLTQMMKRNASVRTLALRIYRKGKSLATVKTYLDNVDTFSDWMKATPDAVLQMKMDWPAIANEYLDHMSARGLSPNHMHAAIAALKKWFEVNGLDVDWRKVETPRIWLTQRQKIPTREELRQIIGFGDLTDKAMFLTSVSSGLRLATLTKLKVKDVRLEMDVPIIVLRPEMAKDRPSRGFVTFITPEAKAHVEALLRKRESQGEKITPESVIFSRDRPAGLSMTPHSVEHRWHRLLKRAAKMQKEEGMKWYPIRCHSLRKYFSTWARLSGVESTTVEMFMGHRSGIEQAYFVSGIEDMTNPQIVDRLKVEYLKGVPALTIFSDMQKMNELEHRLEEQQRQFESDRRSWESSSDVRLQAMEKELQLMREIIAESRRTPDAGVQAPKDGGVSAPSTSSA
jgi:integrase